MPIKGFKLVYLLFSVYLVSCSNQMTSGILTNSTSCVGLNCSSSTTSTAGELSIDPDSKVIAAPVDTSDIIDVSGICQDLDRRNNRILVQVFESEDTSTTPYIDNSIDNYCQDSTSTLEYRSVTSGGTTTKQKCFFVSNGIGLSDSTMSTPQYPQCFNGRFSFQVRLGRVMRKDPYITDISDANPVTNYLVRMKIRTIEGMGAISDSAWSSIQVTRYIAPPSVTADGDNSAIRVKLKVLPAKFRDIRYTIDYKMEGPSYAVSVSGTPVGFTNSVSATLVTQKKADFPVKSDGTSIDDFWHDGIPNPLSPLFTADTLGLMPGMTYTYYIKGSDFSFNYLTFPGPGIYDYGAATQLQAYVPAAQIITRDPSVSNTCAYTLGGLNLRNGDATHGDPFKAEWGYSTVSPNWMTTDPASGQILPASSCVGGYCYVTAAMGFTKNTPYYFAARTYVDKNANNQWDPGELVGQWSSAAIKAGGNTASPSLEDYMHYCVFK